MLNTFLAASVAAETTQTESLPSIQPSIHRVLCAHSDRFSCECEHNLSDSLDAQLFPSMVLGVAPAVVIDDASSLLTYTDTDRSIDIG